MRKIPSFKRNNPLNIRHYKWNMWQGLKGEENGFCVFEDRCFGFRAAFKLLRNYYHLGYTTIEDIVTRFAPPSENPTERYIDFVSAAMTKLGYADNKTIAAIMELDMNNDALLCDLVAIMCRFESGQFITGSEVYSELERSGWYDKHDEPTGVKSI